MSRVHASSRPYPNHTERVDSRTYENWSGILHAKRWFEVLAFHQPRDETVRDGNATSRRGRRHKSVKLNSGAEFRSISIDASYFTIRQKTVVHPLLGFQKTICRIQRQKAQLREVDGAVEWKKLSREKNARNLQWTPVIGLNNWYEAIINNGYNVA